MPSEANIRKAIRFAEKRIGREEIMLQQGILNESERAESEMVIRQSKKRIAQLQQALEAKR